MRHKRHTTYWFILVLALAFAIAYANYRDLPAEFQEHRERQRQVEATSELRDELIHERNRQAELVKKLDEDRLQIESAIREHHQYVRPGETMYILEGLSEESSVAEQKDVPRN